MNLVHIEDGLLIAKHSAEVWLRLPTRGYELLSDQQMWSSPDLMDGLRLGIVGQRSPPKPVSCAAPAAFELSGRALAETGMAA
ncbi:hypothetical protein, partial [Candidatus Nephthysia bennettiae]|uniref:hypothetical protein n=1 Tax=Candidatus Nephthysia bennettiae TaxID=3127016 RepID=UPI0030C6A373